MFAWGPRYAWVLVVGGGGAHFQQCPERHRPAFTRLERLASQVQVDRILDSQGWWRMLFGEGWWMGMCESSLLVGSTPGRNKVFGSAARESRARPNSGQAGTALDSGGQTHRLLKANAILGGCLFPPNSGGR
jgi:hypothetical protein